MLYAIKNSARSDVKRLTHSIRTQKKCNVYRIYSGLILTVILPFLLFFLFCRIIVFTKYQSYMVRTKTGLIVTPQLYISTHNISQKCDFSFKR